MTIEEAKKMFDEIKAQGGNDDEILATLYVLFQKDQLTLEQLEALINVLGYEFDEEFKNMSPEDQKTRGYEDEDDTEATKEEVEEAKEYEGGEQSEVESEVTKEKEEDKKPETEEDEREKAKKLFGFSDK